jgi:hypothetical protein
MLIRSDAAPFLLFAADKTVFCEARCIIHAMTGTPAPGIPLRGVL